MSNKLNWNSLFLTGSIVSLKTSVWRARTKIKANDLGIDETLEVKKALALGSHRLAPEKAFQDIWAPARKAQRSVDYYSVNFGLIQGARYVPEANLPKLLEELKGYKAAFNQAVSDFMANYEAMKTTHLPMIKQALIDATGSEEQTNNAFARIIAEYPSADDVRNRFDLTWSIYAISSPKSAEAGELAETEINEVKSIVADMVKQLRNDMTEKLQDILEIVAKGGRLPEKSMGAAIDLLDRIDSLNILNDSVLSQHVSSMRKVLDGVRSNDYNVTDNFTTNLTEMKATLEKSVTEAIADAEASLTGVGRRKLSIVKPESIVEQVQEKTGSEVIDYSEMGL